MKSISGSMMKLVLLFAISCILIVLIKRAGAGFVHIYYIPTVLCSYYGMNEQGTHVEPGVHNLSLAYLSN